MLPRAAAALARVIRLLSDVGGWIAAAAALLILVLVCAEVALRALAGRSTMIADEIGGYLNVAVVYLGLAYTLKEGGFIRVELLYQKLTGAARIVANWVILVASFAFVVATLIAMTRSVLYVYDQGIRSTDFTQTPLFLPQSLILIGLLLLALQLFAFALERARTLP